MSRQEALNRVWRNILLFTMTVCGSGLGVASFGGSYTVPSLVFLAGNLGAYVSVHKSLAGMSDQDLANLANSWLAIVVPSMMGGVLAGVLYLLFISGIVSGDLFPKIVEQKDMTKSWVDIFNQYAEGPAGYAKLYVWSFIAGFNQKYVVDILEAIRAPK